MKQWMIFGCLGLTALQSGCTEQGFTQLTVLDVFQQDRTNAVDLLVVIDNSCSMIEEQENLARNFEALIQTFNEAETDWQIAVTTTDVESEKFRGLLMSGEDEIIVKGPNGELDRVEYNREWAFAAGTALQLSNDKFSWVSNDTVSNWCLATEAYFDDSVGTPGAANGNCTGMDPEPVDEPGADEGPRAPKTRDIVITEMMAWSVGVDAHCEWFELYNSSDDTLDFTGVSFSDRGNNYAQAPDGFTVGPREFVVVGRSSDAL